MVGFLFSLFSSKSKCMGLGNNSVVLSCSSVSDIVYGAKHVRPGSFGILADIQVWNLRILFINVGICVSPVDVCIFLFDPYSGALLVDDVIIMTFPFMARQTG